MVIDIRGTNGAGKSHVVHKLLGQYEHRIEHFASNGLEAPVTVIPDFDLRIVGKYTTPCGGADGITSQGLICDMIRWAAPQGDVIVEGSIVGSVYKRWADLAREVGNYRFLFLNTPVEECIRRVLQRRQSRGETAPFDPHKTLIPRFEAIRRVYEKLTDDGLEAYWVDALTSVDHVEQLLSWSRNTRL